MGITGKIMVTGASGMLAQEIIHKLDDGNTMIYAVSADKIQLIRHRYQRM